jgi:two-component system cell cycle sensor histidine kinase/response regulator CckA
MLQHVLGEDIELRLRTDDNLYLVRVDPGQLEQVILNLIVNARDAMPRGGTLSIETRNLESSSNAGGEHPRANAGPHVLLRVTDTGTGMDSAVQARIFEPFFTTKQHGKGTGLGLSTIHGIVQQSGGCVRVTSALGLGTTFYVYLPRAVGTESSMLPSAQSAAGESVHGHETVLLVEDDEQVRSLAQSVLERSGFRVIAACGGEEALTAQRSFSEPIQLLLTDVVMPRMSGRQLAEKLCVERPRMKVLFMSGYTDDKVMQHGVFDSGIQFLHKPLTPDGLARKVREVLDAQG